VTGKSGFKVEAVNANGQVSQGNRAWTYDWKYFNSDKSHPTLHDMAVITLKQPIKIDKYPTIATAPAKEGAFLARLRRAPGATRLVDRMQAATAVARDGGELGFDDYYVVKGEKNELVDVGGGLFDPTTNTLYGIVSGRGKSSREFFVTRIDATTARGWVASTVDILTRRGGADNALPVMGGICYGDCLAVGGSAVGLTGDSPFPGQICEGNAEGICEDGGSGKVPDGGVSDGGKDGSTNNPDGSTNNPDGSTNNPDGSTNNPDGTVPPTSVDGSLDGSVNPPTDASKPPVTGDGGADCEGNNCGGCNEANPECIDNTIDYGDCDCFPTPVSPNPAIR
jgi:hypothetical protein